MRTQASVTNVARHFSDYVNRVSMRGERFLLMRGNRPVAELRPIPSGRLLRDLPNILDSLPRLGNADATAFEQDIEAARAEMDERPMRDVWEP